MGLAQHAYSEITENRYKKLIEAIEDFIEILTEWNYKLSDIRDWDGKNGVYVCDEMTDYLWRKGYEFDRRGECYCGKFGEMLACCIRAGFDVAVSPSAGVMGYTVGDIRAIFKNKIPKWVNDFFEKPITNDVPDDVEVWL